VQNRAKVLDTAKGYVTKDRAADHGDMEDNFQRIALYWNAHLGLIDFIKTEDVAAMMALLKIARIHSNPTHIDNTHRQLGRCLWVYGLRWRGGE
jgi:hypothetical protein